MSQQWDIIGVIPKGEVGKVGHYGDGVFWLCGRGGGGPLSKQMRFRAECKCR